MKTIYLVDANSLIYRSYYAIRGLSNSNGFPTNAIFGFLNTIKKILKEKKPELIGVVFDSSEKTLRRISFEQYKAQRPPMPKDLSVQIPKIKEILNAYNITFFEIPQYEADDVIGTIAEKALKSNYQVIIISTDKDVFQLVKNGIKVYNPSKEIILDEKEVKEFFGVYPSQVVDVLSLWGDSTDNVPGVPGIGEKGAKDLINEFSNLENLLKNIDKIKNEKYKQSLKNNMYLLKLSSELVKIQKDLEIELNFEKLLPKEPDTPRLIQLFRELEFKSFLDEIYTETSRTSKEYKTIFDEKELLELINEIKKRKYLSLDVETDSQFPVAANLVGISITLDPDKAFYIPIGHMYSDCPAQLEKQKVVNLLKPIFEKEDIKKIGQNIKYDYIVLKNNGIDMKGIDLDTMILSYLLNPNKRNHNLDELSMNYLNYKPISFNEIAGTGEKEKTLDKIEIEKVSFYSCEDADIALQLSKILFEKIREKSLEALYYEIELPLMEVLAHMELAGVKIDLEILKKLSKELEAEIEKIQEEIFSKSGTEFNINSPKQMAEVLFDKLNLPVQKRTKKIRNFSTDVEVLKELSLLHPVPALILEYRTLSKIKSSYVDAIPKLLNRKTGKIHASYNQTVTATGRLSSSDPNLQNIPIRTDLGKRLRASFIPEPGSKFVSADYSQIELRVLAHLSRDQALIESFIKGEDIHERTAREVFGENSPLSKQEQRRKAKIINFSIIYGTSAFSLAKELEVSTKDAQNFIEKYFEKYKKVNEYIEKMVKEAYERGYTTTMLGRIREVPELKNPNKIIQQAGERIAINTPIQGSAADLMKKAMVDVFREIEKNNLKSKIIIQIHDELILEAPENEIDEIKSILKEKMEKVYPLEVPLIVDLKVGKNWAEV
ncbi:MAG: DNA polymerase I [Acidobacteriota bacterium]